MDCTATDGNGRKIDLSPLIKADGHHLAVTTTSNGGDTEATYYINICRPLNPIDSTLCPPRSSACKVRPNEKPVVCNDLRARVATPLQLFPKKTVPLQIIFCLLVFRKFKPKKSFTFLQSIGRLNERPTFDSSNGKVTIIYNHGEKCTTNPEKNSTSRIVFSCKNGASQVHNNVIINYIEATNSVRSTFFFCWVKKLRNQGKERLLLEILAVVFAFSTFSVNYFWRKSMFIGFIFQLTGLHRYWKKSLTTVSTYFPGQQMWSVQKVNRNK